MYVVCGGFPSRADQLRGVAGGWGSGGDQVRATAAARVARPRAGWAAKVDHPARELATAYVPENPAAMVSRRPASTLPHTAIAGMPCACASCAMAALGLERRLSHPRTAVPVTTRSTPRKESAAPTSTSPSDTPSRTAAPSSVNPKPTPAPAPTPGSRSTRRTAPVRRSFGSGRNRRITATAWLRLDSMRCAADASAPSVDAWVAATPARPSSGCFRSPRPTRATPANRAAAEVRHARSSGASPPRPRAPPCRIASAPGSVRGASAETSRGRGPGPAPRSTRR